MYLLQDWDSFVVLEVCTFGPVYLYLVTFVRLRNTDIPIEYHGVMLLNHWALHIPLRMLPNR